MYHTVRHALEHKRALTREDRDLAIKVLIKFNHLLSKRTRQLGKAKKELSEARKKELNVVEVLLLAAVFFLLGLKVGTL